MEKGQSFREFAMQCARAFGACVTMRDDSMDEPIPKRFEASDYHVKQLDGARAKLSWLRGLNKDEQLAHGQKLKSELVNSRKTWLAKEKAQNERLCDMEKSVMAWKPPTKDHLGLKTFMLEQLGVSKNNCDYIQQEIAKTQADPPLAFYIADVEQAVRDIKYHTEQHAKEVGRADSRTEWVTQLRESLASK